MRTAKFLVVLVALLAVSAGIWWVTTRGVKPLPKSDDVGVVQEWLAADSLAAEALRREEARADSVDRVEEPK